MEKGKPGPSFQPSVRWAFPVLLTAFLLVVPTSLAQSQDTVLDQVAQLGDDAFFTRYPGLLVVKLSMASRLQAATVPAAEIAAFADAVARIEVLLEQDAALANPTYEETLDGLRVLLVLRGDLDDPVHEAVSTFIPLLRLAIDVELDGYIGRADLLVASRSRTSERLDLLFEARRAAETIQDPLDYSRLDAVHESLRLEYEADRERAGLRTSEGFVLASRELPPVFSPGFPAHYAALLSGEERVRDAAALYWKHGDVESMDVAERLAATLDAESTAIGRTIAIVIFVDVAAATLVGLGLASRIVRWSRDHRDARLGDELALKV